MRKFKIRYYDRNPYFPENRWDIHYATVTAETKEEAENTMTDSGKELIEVTEVINEG